MNNLLAASVLPENHVESGLPEPEVRLKPGTAGAYFFGEDGKVVNLVDEETGLLSEAEMAEVGEQLITQLNRIEYLRLFGKEYPSLRDFFVKIGVLSRSG